MKSAWFAVALLAASGELAAHATLQRSTPADGARLPTSPAALVLEFDEPVVPISITLTDAAGVARTLAARPVVDGYRVSLALPAPLDHGGYIASYRITSADSHVVAGAFAFAIGDAAVPAVATSHAAGFDIAFTAWRALRDAFVLTLAGIVAYLACVGAFPFASGAVRVTAAAAVLLSLASIGVTGVELVGNHDLASLAAWHAGTATPIAWSAALATLAALAIVIARPGGRGLRWAAAAALVSSVVLGGHALTAVPRVPAIASLALHVAVVAFWTGSLIALRATLHAKGEAAHALGRFSAIASIAVPVGLAAGAIFAAIELGSLSNLIGSAYGRVVIAKLAIAAPLVALACVNRFVLLPALERGSAIASRRLRTSITLELALVVVAVAAAATLARTPPPRQGDDASASTRTVIVRGIEARFTVSRARDRVAIDVALARSDGSAVDAPEVVLQLRHAQAGIGPLERSLARVAPGRYRLEGFDSAVRGPWTLIAHARIDDFTRLSFATEMPLAGR